MTWDEIEDAVLNEREQLWRKLAMNEKQFTTLMLKNRGIAYRQLSQASQHLLTHTAVYWTEKLLLKLIYRLYSRRLRDALMLVDNDTGDEILGVKPE